MPYQPNPRQIEQQRRFDLIKQALGPRRVGLIVGGGYRGHSGRCLRLAYLKDQRGNPVGYRVSLDEITRQDGKTYVRSTDSIEVKSVSVGIADQSNTGGGLGAVCTVVDPERVLAAAEQLLRRPVFGEQVVL